MELFNNNIANYIIDISTPTHTHLYTHPDTCTYIHTDTHTHTHTHTQRGFMTSYETYGRRMASMLLNRYKNYYIVAH